MHCALAAWRATALGGTGLNPAIDFVFKPSDPRSRQAKATREPARFFHAAQVLARVGDAIFNLGPKQQAG